MVGVHEKKLVCKEIMRMQAIMNRAPATGPGVTGRQTNLAYRRTRRD